MHHGHTKSSVFIVPYQCLFFYLFSGKIRFLLFIKWFHALFLIGTTLARFCSFPVKASMLYLVQSKICKAAVFHSGRRLFSSERRWFYFVPDNVQSSRQGIPPQGQARQEPGGHTEKREWRCKLFQYGGIYLYRGAPAGIHPGPVQHHLHQAGAGPLCRPDGETDPALRRH